MLHGVQDFNACTAALPPCASAACGARALLAVLQALPSLGGSPRQAVLSRSAEGRQ